MNSGKLYDKGCLLLCCFFIILVLWWCGNAQEEVDRKREHYKEVCDKYSAYRKEMREKYQRHVGPNPGDIPWDKPTPEQRAYYESKKLKEKEAAEAWKKTRPAQKSRNSKENRLYEQGLSDGYDEGYEDGIDDAYHAQYLGDRERHTNDNNYLEGYDEGYEDGYYDGKNDTD